MPDYNAITRELRQALPELEIRENEPMSAHCSFKIGGPARLMLFPASAGEAAAVLGLLRREGVRTLIMGNGTNLLVPDEGYDGAVVCMSRPCSDIELIDETKIRAGAGATLAATAVFCGRALAHGPGVCSRHTGQRGRRYGHERRRLRRRDARRHRECGVCRPRRPNKDARSV